MTDTPVDPVGKKLKAVQLNPAWCPAGSAIMFQGGTYTVGDGSMVMLPADVSPEALEHELGKMILVK
jgi:hypothetical protein